jgi:hypothetical protein
VTPVSARLWESAVRPWRDGPMTSGTVAVVLLTVSTGLFMLLTALRSGPSVTGTDGVHYIVGGLHLVRDGRYIGPSGAPELWFPPLYPLLIGVMNHAAGIDPIVAARAISLAFTVLTLALLWVACRRMISASNLFLGMTLMLFASNPLIQQQALLVLSESTATALMLAAFVVWQTFSGASPAHSALLGALSGLSYLTRPEGAIPLVIWTAIDCSARRSRRIIVGYAIAWLSFSMVAVPYLAYLHRHTGRTALSNKFAITLASGRAIYYRCPREYIDPATMEVTFDNCRVTAAQELRRYVSNLRRIVGNAYMQAFFDRSMPAPAGAAFLLLIGYGALCVGRTNRRTAAGLLAQFAAIPVMAALDVKVRYLHMSLPAATMLIGAGSSHLANKAMANLHEPRGLRYLMLGIAPFALMVTVPLLAFRTRGEDVVGLLTRDVGLQARRLPPGVMYEVATSVAYYAGMKRVQLPLNDLDTIERYVNLHQGEPTYLVVSNVGRYDPSVSALIGTASPTLTNVLQGRRGGVVIAVFRLK